MIEIKLNDGHDEDEDDDEDDDDVFLQRNVICLGSHLESVQYD